MPCKDEIVRPTSEGYDDLAHALDLRASLLSAEASLLGAIARRETRGAHHRQDYPNQDPDLQVNFLVKLDSEGRSTASSRPVPPVPGDLEEWARDGETIALEGRLLE